MEIALSQEQGRVPVTIFRVKGRVNLGTAERLQAEARRAIESGARDLLLDLSEVDSLTSAGLRALHHIYNLLQDESSTEQSGGVVKSPHLKLLNPPAGVRSVLRIAGFDMFLEIHDDLEAAVASF